LILFQIILRLRTGTSRIQGRRAAFYIGEGNTLQMLLSGIRRAARYDATGLLDAKHKLAAAALESERYPF
jgi:butyryl-CoA dehydrogenase